MQIVIEIPDHLADPLLEKIPVNQLTAVIHSYILGLAIGAMGAGADNWEKLVSDIAKDIAFTVEILS